MSQHKTEATPYDSTLHQKITHRAYQIFERRGRLHGHDVEDWLRAEREIMAAWTLRTAPPRAKATQNGRPRPKLGHAA